MIGTGMDIRTSTHTFAGEFNLRISSYAFVLMGFRLDDDHDNDNTFAMIFLFSSRKMGDN